MKNVTTSQFESIVREIVIEQEREAKGRNEVFGGIRGKDVLAKINEKIGEEWMVKRPSTWHMSEADMNSIANGRFFKKSGSALLMAWTIVILVLLQVIQRFPFAPVAIYYALCFITTVGFVWLYGKKQKKARRELEIELREAGLIR